MEEDNCEENHRQKKKRKQKDLKSQHEHKKCTADVKNKKCKNVDAVAKEEEGWDESGEQEKKKKKWKLDSNSVSVTNEENGVSKKKKKKQLQSDGKKEVQHVCIYVKEEKLQKKNVKNKALLIKPESKKEEEEHRKGKHKIPKKDQKIKGENLTVSTEQTGEHVKEKKKKKEQSVTTNDSNGTKTKKLKVEKHRIKLEEPEVEVEEVKLKKTKKKVKTEEFDNSLEATEIKSKKKKEMKDERNLKRKAVDDDDVHTKTNVLTQCEKVTEKGKVKKKSKKEKRRKVSVEDVIEVMEPKKKKKAKVDEAEEDVGSRKKDVTVAADAGKKKSKKNKTSVKVKQEINAAVEAGAKKRRKIKEQKDSLDEQQNDLQFSQVDVVFLSQKSGNADEININQERRKALQMEIDEASKPQKPTTPTGLGQWSTAQFDSSVQQQKFLRLMGGFKKGFQPAVETAGGGSMAMGKSAQQQLQQGLLGEFERAQSRRMDFNNKGAGLGFTAPSNKRFSIDINASRSFRFDD